MEYGNLPITGPGAITIGWLSITMPWVAVFAAILIVAGALLMRYFRPVRLDADRRRNH